MKQTIDALMITSLFIDYIFKLGDIVICFMTACIHIRIFLSQSISGRYLLGKSARKEEEEEVMPQMSKRAQAVAALKANKGKKKGKGKKRSKAKRPVAKNAKGRK